MAKVDLAEMIKRYPPEVQDAIHAESAKITEARAQARKQQDLTGKDSANWQPPEWPLTSEQDG